MEWKEALIALISVVLGISFVWVRVSKVLKAIKELADTLLVGAEALSDQRFDSAERAKLAKEYKELVKAFKELFG